MSIKKYGKLNLILGCMFSSKTSTLLARYNRYSIGNKKCLLIKYSEDNRYNSNDNSNDNNNTNIITHDGIKLNATSCTYLYEVDNIVSNYNVVCIDEIQFYKDAHIFCDKWSNEGLIVEACGLNGNYKREPFEIISKLVPMANDILFLKAVSKETGDDAVYSKRTSDEVDDVVIGGSEKYIAADRTTYFIDKSVSKYHIDKFIKYVLIKYPNTENNIFNKAETYINTLDITVNTHLNYEEIYYKLNNL